MASKVKVWEVARDAYIAANSASTADVSVDPMCEECGDTLLAFICAEVDDVTFSADADNCTQLAQAIESLHVAAEQLRTVADALSARRLAIPSVAAR